MRCISLSAPLWTCTPLPFLTRAHCCAKGLKVAIIEGHDVGGTCVNRGCVPSKALLAASGEVRKLRSEHHLKSLGIQVRKGRANGKF